MIDEAHRQFLLTRVHADRVKHSGRTLYDHLLGTHDLLKAWGTSKSICDAGLFHSIYGTKAFKHKAWPVADRETMRALIGEGAERLVFNFCTSNRKGLLYGNTADDAALRLIEAANLIEQGSTSRRLAVLRDTDIGAAARQAIDKHIDKTAETACV